jgi:hypothetical protein
MFRTRARDSIHHDWRLFVPSLKDDTSSRSGFRIDFSPFLWMGAALFTSGLFHLALLWITNAEWDGPLSPRKPGLFGVSAGMTAWSIGWALTQISPWRHDRSFATLMAACLLLEVGLITLQYWRGVPSHFNHGNLIDATVEATMLALILIVTAGIACLVWRSRRLPPMAESLAIAIRAGLWLLLASCGLGLMVTIAGEVNIANGRPYEIWGRAGVLKYPHGAALHAIQVLPILYVVLNWFRVPNTTWLLRSAVAAHVLFMSHALWQTLHGRERLDVDPVAGITLVAAGLLILLPIVVIAWKVLSMTRKAASAK